jgi:hypothetical protein
MFAILRSGTENVVRGFTPKAVYPLGGPSVGPPKIDTGHTIFGGKGG